MVQRQEIANERRSYYKKAKAEGEKVQEGLKDCLKVVQRCFNEEIQAISVKKVK